MQYVVHVWRIRKILGYIVNLNVQFYYRRQYIHMYTVIKESDAWPILTYYNTLIIEKYIILAWDTDKKKIVSKRYTE